MSSDRGPWSPARPVSGRVGGAPGDRAGLPQPQSTVQTPTVTRLARGDRFSGAARASRSSRRPLRLVVGRAPGRAVASAFTAITLVAALIGLLGVLTLSHADSLAPSGGIAYPDLRVLPTASGWSTDVAEIVSPGSRAGCVRLTSSAVRRDRELVTASAPIGATGGVRAGCPTIPSRLALIDTRTGATVWVRNLSRDLAMPVSAVTWTVGAGNRILLSATGARGARLVAIDATSGAVESRASIGVTVDPTNVTVEGSLVMVAEADSNVALVTYTLFRADRLTTPLWSREMLATTPPVLFGDEAIVTVVGRTIRVDGRTGAVSTWRADVRRYSSVQVDDGSLIAVIPPEGVGLSGTVDAFDAAGKRLWSHIAPTDLEGLGASRGCVLTSTSTGLITCVDPATGQTRWTSVQPGSLVPAVPGQRSGDIVLETVAPDGSVAVILLDGDTGDEIFDTRLPPDAVFVASGRTTAYAIAQPSDGQGSASASIRTIETAAIDLTTGTRLWQVSDRDVRAWAGRLVTVSASGRVTELVSPPPPRPLGGDPGGLVRGMLGG